MDYQNEINDILRQVFDLSDDESKQDLTKEQIAKWDSLTHMDLVTTLEREFKVMLDVDEIIAMNSLNSIREIMGGKVGGHE